MRRRLGQTRLRMLRTTADTRPTRLWRIRWDRRHTLRNRMRRQLTRRSRTRQRRMGLSRTRRQPIRMHLRHTRMRRRRTRTWLRRMPEARLAAHRRLLRMLRLRRHRTRRQQLRIRLRRPRAAGRLPSPALADTTNRTRREGINDEGQGPRETVGLVASQRLRWRISVSRFTDRLRYLCPPTHCAKGAQRMGHSDFC